MFEGRIAHNCRKIGVVLMVALLLSACASHRQQAREASDKRARSEAAQTASARFQGKTQEEIDLEIAALESAAKSGKHSSAETLATLYQNGIGVRPHQVEAFFWLSVASAIKSAESGRAQSGDDAAGRRYHAAKNKLQKFQTENVKRRIEEWREHNFTPAQKQRYAKAVEESTEFNRKNRERAEARDRAYASALSDREMFNLMVGAATVGAAIGAAKGSGGSVGAVPSYTPPPSTYSGSGGSSTYGPGSSGNSSYGSAAGSGNYGSGSGSSGSSSSASQDTGASGSGSYSGAGTSASASTVANADDTYPGKEVRACVRFSYDSRAKASMVENMCSYTFELKVEFEEGGGYYGNVSPGKVVAMALGERNIRNFIACMGKYSVSTSGCKRYRMSDL